MSEFYPELFTVTIIAVLMAISPGADFAMICRNSICYNRKAGLYSSLGIGTAIWLHVAYSLAGVAVIVANSEFMYSVVKYLGAAYLVYVGWKTFSTSAPLEIGTAEGEIDDFDAFKMGFITNALNPKTTVFFLSIFSQVVDPETPLSIQLTYGAIISVAHLLWFGIVALFLTQPKMISKFKNHKVLIEKLVGIVLVFLGVKISLFS